MFKNLFNRNKSQKQQAQENAVSEKEKPFKTTTSTSNKAGKGSTVLRSAEPADTIKKNKTLLHLAEEGGWDVKNVPEYNIGDTIEGTYKIAKKFSGGMGFVYITESTSQGIRFAIKQPNLMMLENKSFFARIITEADAWTNLGMHPHIAYCYFVKAIENIPYIFIEYVEGGNLREWIADGKCMDIRTSLDMCIQFCHGMELAHRKGMKHRDIKPENVLMTNDGRVKITDFGLAGKLEKTAGKQTVQKEGQTQVGDVMGTKAYMSPEQWDDPHTVDERADVFSFGVCMWEMLCGKKPYDISIGEVPPPPDPGKLRDDLPDNLKKLLYQVVALKKEERQRDFTELREQLNAIYKTLYQQDAPYYKIEIADTLVDELNNRGYSYFQIGNKEKAIESWEEGLKVDPFHFELNYNYGYLMWNRGKMSGYDFVKKLEACKKSAGDRADYWEALAWVHFEQGNIEAVDAIQASEHRVLDEGFLKALTDPDRPVGRLIRTFEGHTNLIISIAISPNGRYVISGSSDKTLRIWEISTGKEVRKFEGHTKVVHSVAISPDSRFVLSGSLGKTMRLWKISTGKEVRRFEGQTQGAFSLAISPDGRHALSGSGDNTMRLWEISTGKEVKRFEGHTAWVYSVAISPDGRYALSGSGSGAIAILNLKSKDNTLRLWDISNGKEVRRFEGHTNVVHSLAFSPDGRYALSGSWDSTLRLWEVSTGKEVRKFEGHTNGVFSVAISPDGRYALSGSEDCTLRLWEISTGKEVRRFEGHTYWVRSIAISPDGKYALSGCTDKILRLWEIHYPKNNWEKSHPCTLLSIVRDVTTQISNINKAKILIKEAQSGLQEKLYINAFKALRDARSIVGYERDREILGLLTECGVKGGFVRKGLNNGWCERIFEGHTSSIFSVAYSPDGKYALSGSKDKTLRLWEISTGKEVRRFEGHTNYVTSVTFSPDGKYALSGSADKTMRLREISTGKEVRKFEGHTGQVSSVVISHDNRYVLSGSWDGTLRLWDISTGKELKRFGGNTGYVNSVAIAPEGRHVLSGNSRTMQLWEISTGKEIRRFEGHTNSVDSVTISPDGRYALSGSFDTLRLWDISTGKELKRFKGHTWTIYSIAISPDGKYALSGSGDKTLMLWEISTGDEVKRFEAHTDNVHSVAISPDGRYALSGSHDYSLKLWEFDWDWEIPEVKE